MLASLAFVLAVSLPTLPLLRVLFPPVPERTTYAPTIVLAVPDMPSTWEGFI